MSTLHCENITFPSSDRKHTSSAVIYTCPDVPVRATTTWATATPPRQGSTATTAKRTAAFICWTTCIQ